MIIKRKTHNVRSITILGFIIIILISACKNEGFQPTATPGLAAGQGEDEHAADIQLTRCPSEKTLVYLLMDHQAVLDIDAGDGETFYLKFENPPTSFFQVWIEPSGIVSNEGISIPVDVNYHGTANHPNSEKCPEQTFDGVWSMQADIIGTCKNRTVVITIIEEWIDPILRSSCGDPPISGPGLISAPQLKLKFDLSETFPTDGITSPRGGPFYSSYWYFIVPAGDKLPIVPLVPRIH